MESTNINDLHYIIFKNNDSYIYGITNCISYNIFNKNYNYNYNYNDIIASNEKILIIDINTPINNCIINDNYNDILKLELNKSVSISNLNLKLNSKILLLN